MSEMKTVTIKITEKTWLYLRGLAHSSSVPQGTVEDVVQHLVDSAADGMRRPGAWERTWLQQAFGEFPTGTPESAERPWSLLPPTEEEIKEQSEYGNGAPQDR